MSDHASAPPILEIRHLNKSFGGLKAADDVSLSCGPAS